MKTLETIYKKLNSVEKTELETHKVELSLVDDIEKITNEQTEIVKEIEDSGKQAEKLFNEYNERKKALKKIEKEFVKSSKVLEKKVSAFDKSESKADKIYNNLQDSAKELGVKINSIKGVPEFLKVDSLYRKTSKYWNYMGYELD